MSTTPKGTLIIIGGHEAKTGEQSILSEVAARAGRGGRIVIVTVASQVPGELAEMYTRAFSACGVKDVRVLDVRTRGDAASPEAVELLDDAPLSTPSAGHGRSSWSSE